MQHGVFFLDAELSCSIIPRGYVLRLIYCRCLRAQRLLREVFVCHTRTMAARPVCLAGSSLARASRNHNFALSARPGPRHLSSLPAAASGTAVLSSDSQAATGRVPEGGGIRVEAEQVDAIIALGANLGNRATTLQDARRLVSQIPGTSVVTTSPLFFSEPKYVTDQPIFANAAIHIATRLSPHALLAELKRAEEAMGRRNTYRHGPRVVDLDLTIYGDRHLDGVVDEATYPAGPLTVPHVGLPERRFVLEPLAAIAALDGPLSSPTSASSGSSASSSSSSSSSPAFAAGRRSGSGWLSGWRHPQTRASLADMRRACPPDPALEVVTPILRGGGGGAGGRGRRPGGVEGAGPSAGAGRSGAGAGVGDRLTELNYRWAARSAGSLRIMSVLNTTPDSFSDGARFGQATSSITTSTVDDAHPLDALSAESLSRLVPDPSALPPLTTSHSRAVRRAVLTALAHAAEGAAVIDIGGQSTRPGAALVSPAEEAARVVPVVEALTRQLDLWDGWRLATSSSAAAATSLSRERPVISVDTFYASVADAAVAAGAAIVNDVSGGLYDPRMLSTVARLGVPYVLTHARGTPATMQTPAVLGSYAGNAEAAIAGAAAAFAGEGGIGGGLWEPQRQLDLATYPSQWGEAAAAAAAANTTSATASATASVDDVVAGARLDLLARLRAASDAGIPLWSIIADPGLGFAKPDSANAFLLTHPRAVLPAALPLPVLSGPSRKGFLARALSTEGLPAAHAAHPLLSPTPSAAAGVTVAPGAGGGAGAGAGAGEGEGSGARGTVGVGWGRGALAAAAAIDPDGPAAGLTSALASPDLGSARGRDVATAVAVALAACADLAVIPCDRQGTLTLGSDGAGAGAKSETGAGRAGLVRGVRGSDMVRVHDVWAARQGLAVARFALGQE